MIIDWDSCGFETYINQDFDRLLHQPKAKFTYLTVVGSLIKVKVKSVDADGSIVINASEQMVDAPDTLFGVTGMILGSIDEGMQIYSDLLLPNTKLGIQRRNGDIAKISYPYSHFTVVKDHQLEA